MRSRLIGLLIAAALVRLIVFPINQHLYGDAVARTEMTEAWARAPHVITSFGDGAAQFGPLHFYLIATALPWFDREDASRVVSLVFGVLTVLPLFAVTRRYFGARAATWSCLAFVVWGLHLQLSTTGGSEAVALCLMWLAFAAFARGLDERRLRWFALAVLAMNLASAIRYDAWMYIPLLALMPVLQWPERRAGLVAGAAFAVLCLPFPVAWMAGNAVAHGDPLYPLTYIDDFHRTWAAVETTTWGRWWLRAQGIGFWPAMALFTLTPGVALLGALGMGVSWRREPRTRWLIVATIAPMIYYAFRITALANFVPLGRFTIVQVSLLLPFVVPGFHWCTGRLGARRARRIAVATVIVALAMPAALGAYTATVEDTWSRVLGPVSPTATNPRAIMRAAELVRTDIVGRGHTLVLDNDTTYLDLQLGFFGRVTDDKTFRMRWPGFRERVERTPPDFVVLFDRGLLAREPWVSLSGRTLRLATTVYDEIEGFEAPVRVFRRVD